ncbi:Rab5-interacting protein-domain-containing protein [Schizothecium vesticola]|uniref:ER membrane protein complex subunit 6 n=1 Tax=Schizothecium vesticola TaxID=314040 RepID=A0AA40EVB1_9PEZI|nr:Rab5-interacting protein-domain-containing protein [Schizothecium vesticola]
MLSERDLQLSPLVPESIQHNSRSLYNLQSLTASLFGVAAGILGLESYSGFLFYLAFTLLTSVLFYAVRVAPSSASPSSGKAGSGGGLLDTSRYFRTTLEFWTGGVLSGLAGYILTWTLFFGIVRA